ncbi:MAG: tellurite resistance/C4-dicarboxylate transporter family protein [Candidatus Brocadiaceae bacterium]|nr:tellurite resistance/C4-dicarboxylate transporter family protein [Candidatus Brocadiaceae bacterium]
MSVVKNAIRTLHPAYFAFIMSTGIISIASGILGFGSIAYGLFYVNLVAYVVVLTLQVLRVFLYWRDMYKDLLNPKLSLVFFTLVAGTNVLGAQFVNVVNCPCMAKVLWYFGIFLWVAITFLTFSLLFAKADMRIEESIHGGWLIATVGTQSVAVLGALLAPQFSENGSFVMFCSFVWWLIGAFLYIVLITLIFYRLIFFKIAPAGLVPPYWINMGAIAITTLAGSALCLAIPEIGGPYTDFLGFVKGFTLFFWSFGTWWIPFLVILGIWKYVYNKVPFTYSPLYWGLVFPLGMYTACTLKLSQALGMDFLWNIPKYFIYAAYVAWLVIFVSMIKSFIAALSVKEVG